MNIINSELWEGGGKYLNRCFYTNIVITTRNHNANNMLFFSWGVVGAVKVGDWVAEPKEKRWSFFIIFNTKWGGIFNFVCCQEISTGTFYLFGSIASLNISALRSKLLSAKTFSAISFLGRDSSVGIATRYGLDGPGIESRLGGRDFPHPSRPALGPTQPPVQWIPNGYRVFLGCKAAGAWCWPPTPVYVPRSWKSRAIPLLTLWASVACYRVNLYIISKTFPIPFCLISFSISADPF